MRINININGGKKKYVFDTSRISREEAKRIKADVLGVFSGAGRTLRAIFADYEVEDFPEGPSRRRSSATRPAESRATKTPQSDPVPPVEPTSGEATQPPETRSTSSPMAEILRTPVSTGPARDCGPCGAVLTDLLEDSRDIEPIELGDRFAYAVSLEPDDTYLQLWSRVREATRDVGCYPVFIMMEMLELPIGEQQPPRVEQRFSQIRTELAKANPWLPEGELVDGFQCRETGRRFGRGPTAAELEGIESSRQLDEFLFDWERHNFGDEAVLAAGQPNPIEWFPLESRDMVLLVLPAVYGAETIPQLGFWAVDGRSECMAPLSNDLRRWQDDFGAELVANFGTMLQFIVSRPPPELDEAYQLAKEHDAVADATLPLPGMMRRHYAADLIGTTRWFLHSRP